MLQKKRVLIVEDHVLFRQGIKSIIENKSDFTVVGEAGSVSEGLGKAMRCSPDVFLVDISLPDSSGFQFTREICRKQSGARVPILSMHSRIAYVAEAFHCGARGYMLKQSSMDRLVKGLKLVSEGDYYLDSIILPSVFDVLRDKNGDEKQITDDAYSNLTMREQEIFKFMAEGSSCRDIAVKLSLKKKTVENHRANIMKKLNLNSIHQLIRYAFRIGLIDMDLWLN